MAHQSNILVSSKHCACLADFGLARIVEDSLTHDGSAASSTVGTVRWSAPECLCPEMFGFGKRSRKQLPSKSTDIYALGMSIFEASVHVSYCDNPTGTYWTVGRL